MTRKRKMLAERMAAGCELGSAARECGLRFDTAVDMLNEPEVQDRVRRRRQEIVTAHALNRDLLLLWLVDYTSRCRQAAAHLKRNPETKEMEPDGVWSFEYSGAIRGLAALSELLGREEAADDGGIEAWLARQGGEAGV